MAWSNLHAHALLDGHGAFRLAGRLWRNASSSLYFFVVVGCASMARAEIQPSSDIFERRRETEHMDFLFFFSSPWPFRVGQSSDEKKRTER